MIKDKRAVAPIFIFIIIVCILIAIYLFLLIPLPAFTKIRTIINYFLVIILWFVFQGLMIYGYYKLGRLAIVGFGKYKKFIIRITDRTKKYFDIA